MQIPGHFRAEHVQPGSSHARPASERGSGSVYVGAAVAVTATALATWVGLAEPAVAATKSSSFNVSVIVQASCTIAVPDLLANPAAAVAAPGKVCSSAASLTPGIPTPPPTITVTPKDGSMLSIMTLEF